MSADKGLIEREDLERLARLTSAADALLETGTNLQLVEDVPTRADRYRARFLASARLIAERDSEHQTQQRAVKELELRLQDNKNDLAETEARLKKAIEESDVDTAADSNARVPAIALSISNLERKLENARQELANKWQLLDTARSHVLSTRQQVDMDSSEVERLVAIFAHDNDPALEEIRARHRELLAGGKPIASPSQPENTKVINLTRRVDSLPIQVTTRPPIVSGERGE